MNVFKDKIILVILASILSVFVAEKLCGKAEAARHAKVLPMYQTSKLPPMPVIVVEVPDKKKDRRKVNGK